VPRLTAALCLPSVTRSVFVFSTLTRASVPRSASVAFSRPNPPCPYPPVTPLPFLP
jgi:hypothetical protein